MTRISKVLVIYPNGYDASQSMFDVASAFSHALQDLGHAAVLTTDSSPSKTGTTLVFGAHLVPKFGGVMEEGDYIIYNLEQVPPDAAHNEWITPEYIDIMHRFPVWDYSPMNIEHLALHGIDAIYVPIGYHESMSNFERRESVTLTGSQSRPKLGFCEWSGISYDTLDCDVMFVGGMNDRRRAVIDELRKRDLVVATPNGFAAWRDKTISRAKVLLNLHYYDTAVFEIQRVSHYWANSKAVVSELGKDSSLEFQFYGCAEFVPYDKIADTAEWIVRDPYRRKALEKAGFERFSSTLLVDTLKKVVES